MSLNTRYLEAGRDSSSDECLTPRYAVRPLIKYLKGKNYRHIWCPFDKSDSLYVQVLRSASFTVTHTHIEDGQDFFDTRIDCDIIVSNPPFSLKDRILERVYSFGTPFALLLPQNSLQSLNRTPLFIAYGLEYLGFDRRICFYTNNDLSYFKESNHFASGYFCKNLLPFELVFEHIVAVQEPYYQYKYEEFV